MWIWGSRQPEALVQKKGWQLGVLSCWGMSAATGTRGSGWGTNRASSVPCSSKLVIGDLLKELIYFEILKT